MTTPASPAVTGQLNERLAAEQAKSDARAVEQYRRDLETCENGVPQDFDAFEQRRIRLGVQPSWLPIELRILERMRVNRAFLESYDTTTERLVREGREAKDRLDAAQEELTQAKWAHARSQTAMTVHRNTKSQIEKLTNANPRLFGTNYEAAASGRPPLEDSSAIAAYRA